MGFEIFVPQRNVRGRTSEPMIRVDRKGTSIHLTKAAVELLPKACTHLVLAFSDESRQIALLATAPTDPKAIRITTTGQRRIAMGQFAEHYRIAEGRYPVSATNINDRGALVSVAVNEHTEETA